MKILKQLCKRQYFTEPYCWVTELISFQLFADSAVLQVAGEDMEDQEKLLLIKFKYACIFTTQINHYDQL